MNLSLNPEQFLAVYNGISNNSSLTAQEVKTKMDTLLLEALTLIDDSKNQSKFSNWMKQESEKVLAMKNELKSMKINPPEPSIDDGLYYPPAQTQ